MASKNSRYINREIFVFFQVEKERIKSPFFTSKYVFKMRPLSSTQFIHWILLSRVNKSVGLLIKNPAFQQHTSIYLQPCDGDSTDKINKNRLRKSLTISIGCFSSNPSILQSTITYLYRTRKKKICRTASIFKR